MIAAQAAAGPAVHPLEQRFMAHMMGQQAPALVRKPVSQPAPPSLSLTSPLAVSKPAAPPGGLTPPSAFPTYTPSGPKPIKLVTHSPATAPPGGMQGLNLTSPLAQKPYPRHPSGASTAAPGAGALFVPENQPATAETPAEDMQLGFDIGEAEQQIAPEQKKKLEFDAIMDRFKTVITTEQKLGAYDLADKIGVADFIEDFYEFLAHPDRDGIISYKGDEVKINKTKIMGALMLGDNSMLDRIMATFRIWLLKVLK